MAFENFELPDISSESESVNLDTLVDSTLENIKESEAKELSSVDTNDALSILEVSDEEFDRILEETPQLLNQDMVDKKLHQFIDLNKTGDLDVYRSEMKLRSVLDIDPMVVLEEGLPFDSEKIIEVEDPFTGKIGYLSVSEKRIWDEANSRKEAMTEWERDAGHAMFPKDINVFGKKQRITLKDKPEDVELQLADYFFDNIEYGKFNYSQRVAAKRGLLSLTAAAKGYNKEQIDQLFGGGLQHSIYDPVDFLVDLLTGGVRRIPSLIQAATKLATGKPSKALFTQAVKGLSKETQRELFYGSLAGGFMSVADYYDSGTTVNLLVGLLGPSATGVLLSSGRVGLRHFLASARTNNKSLYNSVRKALAGQKDKFSKTANEILDDIEAKDIKVGQTEQLQLGESAGARTAKNAGEIGDANAINKTLQAVQTALLNNESISTKLAQKATEAGPMEPASLMPGKSYKGPAMPAMTEFPSWIHNSSKISDNTSWQYFHNATTGIKDPATKHIHARVYQDDSIYTGPVAREVIEDFRQVTKGDVTSDWIHPERSLKNMSNMLVGIPTSQEKFKASTQKAAHKYIKKDIFGGLNKREKNELQQLFRLATDHDEVLELAEGGLRLPSAPDVVIPASDKLIQRYYRGDFLMNEFYYAANKEVRRVFINAGHKQLDNNFIVQTGKRHGRNFPLRPGMADIEGNVWTKQKVKDGWVAAKIINTADPEDPTTLFKFLSPDEAGTRLKEIDQNIQLLPKREGYSPIGLNPEKNKYLIAKLFKDNETGEWRHNTIAAAATRKELDQALPVIKEQDQESFYVGFRKDEKFGTVDLAPDSDIVKHMMMQDPPELQALIRELEVQGFDTAVLDSLRKYVKTFSYKRNSHFRARGTERIKSAKDIVKKIKAEGEDVTDLDKIIAAAEEAPLKPAKLAYADYVDNMSNFIAHTSWNQVIKDEFLKKYGKVLGNAKQRRVEWDDEVKLNRADLSAEDKVLALEAEVVQKQLKEVFNVPATKLEQQANTFWTNKRDKLYKDGKYFAGNIIDKYLVDSGIIIGGTKALKKIGTHTLLGMGALSQGLVQQTAALNAFKYANEPDILLQAFRDFNKVRLRGRIASRFGIKPDEETKVLHDLIERSGFISAPDFDYADRIIQSLGRVQGGVRKVGAWTLEKGLLPMQIGENIGREVIWFAEANKLKKTIQAGLHPHMKESDIGSDEFLHRVNIEASKTAGNFSRFNKARIQKDGPLSAVTQFMSFPLFQAEYMFGKGLTATQRTGVFMAWFAAFGYDGIPFMGDIVGLGELAYSTKDPNSTNAVKRTVLQTTKEMFEGMKENSAIPVHSELRKIADRALNNREITEDSLLLFHDINDEAEYNLIEDIEGKRKFAQRLLLTGGVTAFTKGDVNFASRAGLGDNFSRYLDGLDYAELLGPGLATAIGIVSNGITSTTALIDMWGSDEFNKNFVQQQAQQLTQRISGLGRPIQSVGREIKYQGEEKRAIFDSKGFPLIIEPSAFQTFLTAIGVTPGDVVALNERRWDAILQSRHVRDYIWRKSNEIAKLYSTAPNTAEAKIQEIAASFPHPDLTKEFIRTFVWQYVEMNTPLEERTLLLEHRKKGVPLHDLGGEQ